MTRYVVMCTIPCDEGQGLTETYSEEYSGQYYLNAEDAQEELEEAQDHPAVLNAWIKSIEIERSNPQEFLSFLGTCMTFYNTHLSPYEQTHVIAEIGSLLHEHIAPKNYSKLMKYVYGEKNPAYMDTDSYQELKKVFLQEEVKQNGKDDI